MNVYRYLAVTSLLLPAVSVASIDIPHPTFKLSESRSLLPSGSVDFSDNPDGYPYHDYIPMDASLILESGGVLNEYLFTPGYELSAEKANAALGKERFNSSTVGIHDFYPPYFVEADLKPTVHFQDFYNPFWHQTPNARQYWLYYINNIWFFNHISDWESVAYFFGKDFQPVDAVYSTHYEGNKHSWADVNKIGGSPLIYVSNGGHGSYAHSGETKFGVFTDYHRGEKETVNTFTAVDLSSTAGAGVLTFSAPWGVAGDKKAPHGPRLRVDKDQTLLDSYRARNPFKNCETYPDIEMYGTSVSLPEYGVAIVESNNRNASKEKIEALLNYGPHRWASGYTEDGSCEPVALPQPVKELELSAIDKIAVKWEGGASSKAPFGYRLSFYHDTEQDDQTVSVVMPWLEVCADESCSFEVGFEAYTSSSSTQPLCVDVEAFHPGGASDVVSTCEKPSVALVVDDTGSMGSEINLVKNQLTSFLQGYEDGEAMYQLVTFKDTVNTRKITRQRAEIVSAVGTINASGGGDCPESSGAALLKAAETMAEGASVIFVTDASSNSLADLVRAKSEILRKRGKLTTLLSSTCDSSSGPSSKIASSQVEPRTFFAESVSLTSASTFDGLDWESDFGLERGRVLIENDANQLRHIGFVQDENHTDLVDNFRVMVSAGKKTLNVRQLNNFHVRLNIRAVGVDGVTNRMSQSVTDRYNGVYQSMWNFEQETTEIMYIEVTANQATSIPTEYTIEIIDNPYVGLNNYRVYEEFTKDVNGSFYYVPEIKRGDSTRFAEALNEALTAALTPVISSVTPNVVTANNKYQTVNVKLLNVSWTGSESVEFGDESGLRIPGVLGEFDGQLAAVSFNVARVLEAKCYNLYVSGADYQVESECALVVEESPVNIDSLLAELRSIVQTANIYDSVKSMLLYRIDIIDVHVVNGDFSVAQNYLADFSQWVKALSGFLVPIEDVSAMTLKVDEAIAELNAM